MASPQKKKAKYREGPKDFEDLIKQANTPDALIRLMEDVNAHTPRPLKLRKRLLRKIADRLEEDYVMGGRFDDGNELRRSMTINTLMAPIVWQFGGSVYVQYEEALSSLSASGRTKFVFYSLGEVILLIVEAKTDNFNQGIAQLMMELYAADVMNQVAKTRRVLCGVVTTGFTYKDSCVALRIAWQSELRDGKVFSFDWNHEIKESLTAVVGDSILFIHNSSHDVQFETEGEIPTQAVDAQGTKFTLTAPENPQADYKAMLQKEEVVVKVFDLISNALSPEAVVAAFDTLKALTKK